MANVDDSWVVDFESELNGAGASSELDDIWTKHSIYMVPALIKDLNPKAYEPRIISFGPYHYGDEKLRPMEVHKRRALVHFLKRAQKPLRGFMSALEEVAGELMDSYQGLDGRWREERGRELFLRLMLFDGCFMLEVLRFSKVYRSGGFMDDYAWTDPVFSHHGMTNIMLHIKMDMLRIENQLPLLVLKRLVAAEAGRAPDDDEDDDEINRLVLDFMGSRPVPSQVGLGLHTLDLFRRSCVRFPAGFRPAQDSLRSRLQRALVAPAKAFLRSCCQRGRRTGAPETDEDHLPTREEVISPDPSGICMTGVAPGRFEAYESPPSRDRVPLGASGRSETYVAPSRRESAVPSAAWLVEAGVRFEKSGTDSRLDVRFVDGVLALPAVTVDDATECELLNLMAFERLHVLAGNEVTCYVAFMDVMVDSAKDVAVLASEGIIRNAVGTDDAVAELFNSLGRYVTLDSGSGLYDVLRSVNEYYTRGWNKWRAKMIHFYFKSPLANSVAAFVFLLLLTLLQTVYAVLQYHTRSS